MQIEPNHTQLKRSAKVKPKKNRKRNIALVIFSFFILIAAAGGYTWWKLNSFLGKVTTEDSPAPVAEEQAVPKVYNQQPVSMVIIGKDSRGGLGLLNTDVIIVAALNPKTRHVTMMAVPRDTGVKVPGYSGWAKINSVYAKGEAERRNEEKKGETVTVNGTSLLKKTLQEALGIPVDYYATVDFEGFKSIIDKLGGVEINVDKSMKYDDPTDGTHIDLSPGLQTLNGEQALGFVRHRKDNRGPKYFSNDFDRGMRQQIVIKAVVDKMKSFTGLSSFFSVLEVAGDHIHTDLSKDQIKGLILDFKSIGSDNIASLESGGYWDPVSSHTIIPKDNLEKIQLAFRTEMGIDGEMDSSQAVLQTNTNSNKAKVVSKPKPRVVTPAPAKPAPHKGTEQAEGTAQPEPSKDVAEGDNPTKSPAEDSSNSAGQTDQNGSEKGTGQTGESGTAPTQEQGTDHSGSDKATGKQDGTASQQTGGSSGTDQTTKPASGTTTAPSTGSKQKQPSTPTNEDQGMLKPPVPKTETKS